MRLFTVVGSLILAMYIAAAAQEAGAALRADGNDPVAMSDTALTAEAPRHITNTLWIKQLWHNGFKINDPAVAYPRFPRFALKVYNWGNAVFNTYNEDYVVGTGKNWKLQAKSYNWIERSALLFPGNSMVSMHSTPYCDAGLHLSFMAVSIGYMWNMNKLFSQPNSRHTFSFDFICSRFLLSMHSVGSQGNMTIDRFGDYKDGKGVKMPFDDCSLSSFTFDAFYFFNYSRYSHAAAYSYSKYQLRSAGTALVGFNLTQQDVYMNFAQLSPDLMQYLPVENSSYKANYRAYGVLGGYAYNWVLHPRRWLFNITALGSAGLRRTLDTDLEGDRNLKNILANSLKINSALVYNHRALFAAATLRLNAMFAYGNTTNFNMLSSLTVAVGARF